MQPNIDDADPAEELDRRQRHAIQEAVFARAEGREGDFRAAMRTIDGIALERRALRRRVTVRAGSGRLAHAN